jgi:hypothetical protein
VWNFKKYIKKSFQSSRGDQIQEQKLVQNNLDRTQSLLSRVQFMNQFRRVKDFGYALVKINGNVPSISGKNTLQSVSI